MAEERDQAVTEEEVAVEEAAPPPLEEMEGEDPAAPVEQDLDELAAVARERDEYLSLAQRTQADCENFHKRKAREVSEAERRGMTKLAKELLPAVDNLELSLTQLPEEARKGVQLVFDEVVAALARVGIEGFSPVGERFDPTEHEAMASHPVEGAASGTVAEVYQRGYRLNGGVLRPARVVVAE
ncbi:nucleotide exchange factor GrpE [soil metagenome]